MRTAIPLMLAGAALLGQAPSTKPIEWVGTWEFQETWPGPQETTNCVVYKIHIMRRGVGLGAQIESDGYMTLGRVLATAKQEGGTIRLYFLKAQSDDRSPQYKPGELLLELSKSKGKTITTWHAFLPTLDKFQSPGEYFQQALP
ncbi:MAG: hypothetical protein HXX12_00835 [Geothrix sp.]|uniref:Uncharacterized protein n=1 Tax=Candidatus Chlorohelix allophototropha TaxID=3003348 RepID=A0A8T7MAI9_9CHLR|nr:DUF5991 domain-containing protein [Geothrix sp.]NWJ39501.1 hypothetical protein [Geothrix sp.]NWJ49145.1 hypothetical protein [Chloroflexota bacterium]WIL19276.1 MAG: DUF5991 domain-containing protein [Geothrix sp.]